MTVPTCNRNGRPLRIRGETPKADWLSTNWEADYQMPTHEQDQLTYRIIGAAMRVHNALGPGLKEAFYQRALSLELEKEGLSYQPEYCIEIHLDDARVGLLYLDHLVQDEIVVEEKALSHMLTDDQIAQVITYLCATGKRIGLLLNFGRGSLEYKRILPPKNVNRWRERISRYVWIPKHARSANPLDKSADSQSAGSLGMSVNATTNRPPSTTNTTPQTPQP